MMIYDNSCNATSNAGSPANFNSDSVSNFNNYDGHYGSQSTDSQPSIMRCMTANEWMRQAACRKDPVSLYGDLWQEEEVCCLFADSNLGKSIYAVQIAHEISKSQKVVYFDFELTDKQFQLRYTDPQTGMFRFNDNFIRCELSIDSFASADFEGDIMRGIESVALEHDAKVLIIDNLTWLCNASETGDSAGVLMQNLIAMKKVYGWSIMVIAHTPKRQPNSPITQNDLAGSKRLFNFFDSVFAIGQSAKDQALRYVKQVKVRAGEFKLHADNVMVTEIVKENGFTSFHTVGYDCERTHLREPDENDRALRAQEAQRLKEEGLTVREVAKKLNLSKGAIQRLLKMTL